MRSIVLGTGHYVPPRVVTNHDLAAMFDTSDEWIRQRTGIVERRYVEPGVGPSDLAYEAALPALAMAGLEPAAIDCILFATLHADYQFPGSGVLLARRLGIAERGIPAFDIRNQCSGYLYALQIADAFIRLGLYRHVLIAGAEVHSTGIEFADRGRDVTVLFGDGAGVTILGPGHDPERGVLSVHLHSDGTHAERLMIEAPTARARPHLTPEMIEQGRTFPRMEGRFVFKHAVARMPEAVREALAHHGLQVADIDHWLFHQANLRINEAVAQQLGIAPERCYHNIHKYGNLSAGSIPALLDEVHRAGRLRPGDLVCMAGFGSGFTWGSALVRW
ncbi:MAG: 3-oxoacyl-[acyl-carrier-protein] synthase 3 [Planctomycetota bacterium]|nr:MAG: 3-oxoacyl-[acyl-carrier-protein] synthase 3 [Planctomycetota bacterium]